MTDLPQWHLHVTVKPHRNWSLTDVSSALARDIVRHDIKPVVLTNCFDDHVRNYKEIIPTKHFSGTEAQATRELFQMGVLLNNSGWRVKRLKIEGDPTPTHEIRRRAIYFETHIKIEMHHIPLARQLGASISVTARSTFATFRHQEMSHVTERAYRLWTDVGDPAHFPHIEAAVLDTAPEMDEEWLHQ